jgi:hypothetical protein
VDYARDNEYRSGGPAVVEILDVRKSEDAMRIRICLDLTGTWFELNGERQPPAENATEATVSVIRGDDGWRVLTRLSATGRDGEGVTC